MERGDKINQSVLEEPDIKRLIEFRHIKEEDWPLLEDLAAMPKEMLFDFHNLFNLSRERSAEELTNQLNRTEDLILRKYLGLLIYFAENYDWMACWNMERVLERRFEKQ